MEGGYEEEEERGASSARVSKNQKFFTTKLLNLFTIILKCF